jgi:hypothetical protein
MSSSLYSNRRRGSTLLTQVATYRTPTIEIVANDAKSAFAD